MGRPKYDWGIIEREYSLGQKSLRTLSSEFGPTPGAISKHAKKHGWIQDKAPEVRKKTAVALLKESLIGNRKQEAQETGNTATQEDVDRAVETNVRVIREHRKDIKSGRQIIDLLQAQLITTIENREALEDLIFKDTKGADGEKDNFKRRAAMLKAVSLPSHAGAIRNLTNALKNLIPLERQAFNLDERDGGTDPISKILDEVSRRTKPLVSED